MERARVKLTSPYSISSNMALLKGGGGGVCFCHLLFSYFTCISARELQLLGGQKCEKQIHQDSRMSPHLPPASQSTSNSLSLPAVCCIDLAFKKRGCARKFGSLFLMENVFI